MGNETLNPLEKSLGPKKASLKEKLESNKLVDCNGSQEGGWVNVQSEQDGEPNKV